MKTTNEMIFATLRTKTDKPAKYAEQLRKLGYTVENTRTYNENTYERTYWAVNGLELTMGCKWLYAQLRGWRTVDKVDNIKKIDFVNYFATLEARTEKAERMAAHDAIEETRRYEVIRTTRYMGDDGKLHRWRTDCSDWRNAKEIEVHYHHHYYNCVNHTISEYEELKRKAEARGYGWRSDKEDYEIEWAKREVKSAEERVERLYKQLEAAEREVQRCRNRVRAEVAKKSEGQRELHEWLVAKGIR